MTEAEVAKLLTVIAVVDNREIDRARVAEWTRILGHISFDLARRAVELHFAESTEYLMPAHIVANARRLGAPKSNDTTPAIHAGRQPHPRPSKAAEDDLADGVTEANWPKFLAGFQAYNRELRDAGFASMSEVYARETFDEQIRLMNEARRRAGREVAVVIES